MINQTLQLSVFRSEELVHLKGLDLIKRFQGFNCFMSHYHSNRVKYGFQYIIECQ